MIHAATHLEETNGHAEDSQEGAAELSHAAGGGSRVRGGDRGSGGRRDGRRGGRREGLAGARARARALESTVLALRLSALAGGHVGTGGGTALVEFGVAVLGTRGRDRFGSSRTGGTTLLAHRVLSRADGHVGAGLSATLGVFGIAILGTRSWAGSDGGRVRRGGRSIVTIVVHTLLVFGGADSLVGSRLAATFIGFLFAPGRGVPVVSFSRSLRALSLVRLLQTVLQFTLTDGHHGTWLVAALVVLGHTFLAQAARELTSGFVGSWLGNAGVEVIYALRRHVLSLDRALAALELLTLVELLGTELRRVI